MKDDDLGGQKQLLIGWNCANTFMTVVRGHARSHVPILALDQFSSAGFSEKKIIAPVITV